MKKYLFFFGVHLLAVLVWVAWALPIMGEGGPLKEEVSWLAAQLLVPVFLYILLRRSYRPGLWFTLVWGGLLILSGAGLLGWALMGSETPVPVHVTAALLLFEGLGLFSAALKDLKWISERSRYALEDE